MRTRTTNRSSVGLTEGVSVGLLQRTKRSNSAGTLNKCSNAPWPDAFLEQQARKFSRDMVDCPHGRQAYLIRTYYRHAFQWKDLESSYFGPVWLHDGAWGLFGKAYSRFHWSGLAADFLILVLLIGLVCYAFERWRRKRSRVWNWYVRDLIVAMTVFCVLAGWCANAKRLQNQVDPTLLKKHERRPRNVRCTHQIGWCDLWAAGHFLSSFAPRNRLRLRQPILDESEICGRQEVNGLGVHVAACRTALSSRYVSRPSLLCRIACNVEARSRQYRKGRRE